MNHDFQDPINAENMPYMVDSALAMDFLMAAKNGVRNLAFAISETASPRLRAVLRRELVQALAMQTEIATLMMQKRWFQIVGALIVRGYMTYVTRISFYINRIYGLSTVGIQCYRTVDEVRRGGAHVSEECPDFGCDCHCHFGRAFPVHGRRT